MSKKIYDKEAEKDTLPIYLINLDRSTDRLQSFYACNQQLVNVLRFPAVDGSQLSLQNLQTRGLMIGELPYTKGALGCAMSYLHLWDQCIADGRPVTICDDDAIFHPNFHDKTKKLIESLDSDWDFILWGWNFDSICSFDMLPGCSPCVGVFNQQTLRAGISTYQQLNFNPQLFRLNRAFGTVCYSLSPKGAKRLKALTFPLVPLQVFFPILNRHMPNNGIDIAMNAYYTELNAYVSFPPLVITENDHAISTVQEY